MMRQTVMPFASSLRSEPDQVPAVIARLRAQVEAEYGRPSLLFTRFIEFHDANPHVLELLLRFSDQVLAVGRQRFGIAALFERVRWYVDIETHSAPPIRAADGQLRRPVLKLNNNHRAYYARLLMLLRPALVGVLETRQLGPGREPQIV
jgi:hypothetical protein